MCTPTTVVEWIGQMNTAALSTLTLGARRLSDQQNASLTETCHRHLEWSGH